MTPKVSICVPNLNTLPFLPERFETIFNQTFQDWELLVYDSYSNDGAWEYIQQLAARDSRIRAWQGPREGTPGSWSPCVRQASGEYIYIATSDDTMPADCIQKLIAALQTHPECDLAHCTLKSIDETGRETADDWWFSNSAFARSSGELLNRSHIRVAPFDGLLHLLGEPVYISITQLLVRKSLFDRIGLFESRWGSVGDFHWNMKASLVANTVHVPDTWGGWRVHPTQATSDAAIGTAEHFRKVDDMIDHAISACEKHMAAPLRERLISQWSRRSRDLREFFREVPRRADGLPRKAFIVSRLLAGSPAARGYLQSRWRGPSRWPDSAPELMRKWLSDAGIHEVLKPI